MINPNLSLKSFFKREARPETHFSRCWPSKLIIDGRGPQCYKLLKYVLDLCAFPALIKTKTLACELSYCDKIYPYHIDLIRI